MVLDLVGLGVCGRGFGAWRCDFGRGAKVRLRVGCVDGRGVPGRREGGMKSNGEDGREVDLKADDMVEDEVVSVTGGLDILIGRSKSPLSVELVILT